MFKTYRDIRSLCLLPFYINNQPTASYKFRGRDRMAEKEDNKPEKDFVKPKKDPKSGKYENPDEFTTWHIPDKLKFIQVGFWDKDNTGIPQDKKELDKTLPVKEVDFDKLQNPNPEHIQVFWIGHASVLVQFDGVSILCDPVFSERSGPANILGKFAPKRYRKAPCTVKELPWVDVVLLSHDHYDHLDYNAIIDLKNHESFGQSVKFLVPEGLKSWFEDSGCIPENVIEKSWWEEYTLKIKDKEIKFACTPTQHWCSRTLIDQNKRLWCSWAVLGPTHRFYFGGDSGYTDLAFKQIGKKYGPFSLAALPIGSYEPRWYMHPQHMCPEDAVKVHIDIKAKYSLGIHWGTMKHMGTNEPYLEPPELVAKTLLEKKLKEKCFRTINHGEIWEITSEDLNCIDEYSKECTTEEESTFQ